MLKPKLITLSQTLGFALCRVAACGPPPHARQFLEWLDEGCAGEMGWMERNRERRLDPQQALPGARSVIVLAMNYWQGEGGNEECRMKNEELGGNPDHSSFYILHSALPRIARYALGADYHDLIGERLRALDEFLRGRGGEQKCCVDTGPVLERDFAALAGAGWHGKSTMLIHPQLGTWFFLAEILTTLELDPDPPEPDRCGRCTRCIDACPTGAITAPYRLDARRCISYLTIELKGSIPVELRPLLGNRVFGCDDCLAACPWNRFAQASRENAFAARAASKIPLRDCLGLTDDDFRALFSGSPILRSKRRGFLRNVCVALGNTGGPDDLPALRRAAADPEPLIAEHALWAIARIEANKF